MSKLLETVDLKQYFEIKLKKGKKESLKALDGVSVVVNEGETLGIVGESGCGKSTLGKTVLRLYKPTAGKVIFDGEDISALKGPALKDFHAKTAMIFQDPQSCLNPRRKIAEIIEEPFVIHHLYDPKTRKQKVNELCDMVGLSRAFLSRYPHEMSGGQKQRVGIARALALRPKLVVCDEPVSALDVSIQAQVINLLSDLQKELSLTYLFISHNLSVIEHLCDRIQVMYLGRVVEIAPAARIYENPLHPYTNALLSAIPAVGEKSERVPLGGDLPSPIHVPSGCPFHPRCPSATPECAKKTPELRENEPGHWVSCLLCE